MKFIQHELYANIYMRDVLFYVVDYKKNYDGTTTIRGTWWNKGQMGKPWPMGVKAELLLTDEQIKDWVRYAR